MNSYNLNQDIWVNEQYYGPILNWLNSYAQKDEMVFTSFSLSNVIPAYTSLNAFASYLSGYYLIPQEYQGYIEDGLFLNYRLDGLSSQQTAERFFEERDKIFSHIYTEAYRRRIKKDNKLFQEKFNYLVNAYQEFLSLPLDSVLAKYNIQYVIWDMTKQPNWQLEQYEFLEEIARANEIKIYTIK